MTKRRLFSIAAAALCVAVLAAGGCQKAPKPNQGQGQGQGQQQEQPKGPYFKINLPDEFLMSYNQGAASWVVDTDITDWTATSSEGWCKPTAKAKELWLDVEDYDCRYENGAYRYDPPRICTVTVKAGTVFNKTFKVVQDTHTMISFTQLTYSQNYGNYNKPYLGESPWNKEPGTVEEFALHQVSGAFMGEIPGRAFASLGWLKPTSWLCPFSLTYGLYADKGQLLPDLFGFTVGLRYDFRLK